MSWPVDIPALPANKNLDISPLDRHSEEYKQVASYFRLNVPESREPTTTERWQSSGRIPINTITKIDKINNPKLRELWNFNLKRTKEKHNNAPDIQYVKLLFHGTSTMHPSVIYKDDTGWKINYSSSKNLWGPGLYFGADAQYVDKYV